MARTTVVVVSYRPGSWLAPCLQSVRDQADQVVVVDNGSDHRAASLEAERVGVEAVRCRKNLGFAGGVAAGVERATGDVVGLLNDDAVADPGWLAASTAALEDPAVAAVTPKVLLSGRFGELRLPVRPFSAPGDGRVLARRLHSVKVDGAERLDALIGRGVHQLEEGGGQRWRWTTGVDAFYVPLGDGGGEPVVEVNGEAVAVDSVTDLVNHAGSRLLDHGYGAEIGLGLPDDGRVDLPTEPFGFSGTAPVFRRATLAELGGFALRFFAYQEDTDWCLRARLAGRHIAYQPQAVVRHRLSATSGGPSSSLVRFLGGRNSILCLVRNAPLEVAQRYLWRLIAEGRHEGVRRAVLAHLPWALATRRALSKTWELSPREVWDRWAGAPDTTYAGPAGTWPW